jgi:hypothetical protein
MSPLLGLKASLEFVYSPLSSLWLTRISMKNQHERKQSPKNRRHREHTRASFTEGTQESVVLKLAQDHRPNGLRFEPEIQVFA